MLKILPSVLNVMVLGRNRVNHYKEHEKKIIFKSQLYIIVLPDELLLKQYQSNLFTLKRQNEMLVDHTLHNFNNIYLFFRFASKYGDISCK